MFNLALTPSSAEEAIGEVTGEAQAILGPDDPMVLEWAFQRQLLARANAERRTMQSFLEDEDIRREFDRVEGNLANSNYTAIEGMSLNWGIHYPDFWDYLNEVVKGMTRALVKNAIEHGSDWCKSAPITIISKNGQNGNLTLIEQPLPGPKELETEEIELPSGERRHCGLVAAADYETPDINFVPTKQGGCTTIVLATTDMTKRKRGLWQAVDLADFD